MSDESDFIVIGRVRRAHGTEGEMCVEIISDFPERFDALDTVLVRTEGAEPDERPVDSVRWKGNLVLMKLAGVDDRTGADAYRGALLGVKRKDVHPLPDGEFYVFDLVGCRVLGENGDEIGEVDDVLRMPANDVLVVKADDREVLIPVVKEVVKSVDLTKKTLTINILEGLLGA